MRAYCNSSLIQFSHIHEEFYSALEAKKKSIKACSRGVLEDFSDQVNNLSSGRPLQSYTRAQSHFHHIFCCITFSAVSIILSGTLSLWVREDRQTGKSAPSAHVAQCVLLCVIKPTTKWLSFHTYEHTFVAGAHYISGVCGYECVFVSLLVNVSHIWRRKMSRLESHLSVRQQMFCFLC